MSSPTEHARLMELFDAAVELSKPDVKAWLDALSTIDSIHRPQLEAMLAVDSKSDVFRTKAGVNVLARDMLESAVHQGPRLPQPGDEIPDFIGEYKLMERIGVGGMGSVFRAHQERPDRIVALKVLHPWLMSPAALERFRFEAQALASLTHPGIPPIYAVGQHEGLVYFAMEMVEGASLLLDAEDRQLETRAKVELLARVAEAVHHAHLRGFVHRDLKPDNVRVAKDGLPRVLDFGIAAGLGEHRAEIAGTPSYMSPEQFDPDVAVDLRTDVFALGVMLFQLLTGKLPVTVPKGRLATVQALKQEPAPRLRTVAPELGRELEAIVACALEPKRENRYQSAAELADDLRHYLRHEPVKAIGGGRLYRTTRFIRRNRGMTAIAGALVLSLLSGVIVSIALYVRAKQSAAQAETEAKRARSTAEFLGSVLSEADGDNHGGRGATIGQALDHAVEKLDKNPLDPHVDSFLRGSLSSTYMGLGEWNHSRAQALKALETWEKNGLPDDDEDLSEILRLVAGVTCETGEVETCVEAADRSLAIEVKRHGSEPNPHTSYSLHVDGFAHRGINDCDGADAIHARAVAMERELKMRGEPEFISEALDQSAFTLIECGRFDRARPMLEESLALTLEAFGPDRQETAIVLAHQSWLEQHGGDLEKARTLIMRANEIRMGTLGKDHMRTAQGFINLAQIDVRTGRFDEAEASLTFALPVAAKAFADAPGRTAWSEVERVEVLIARKQFEDAEALARKLLEAILKQYGTKQTPAIEGWTALAHALAANGKRDEARTVAELAVSTSKSIWKNDRPRCVVEAEQTLASLRD